jgi:hypothetical protein
MFLAVLLRILGSERILTIMKIDFFKETLLRMTSAKYLGRRDSNLPSHFKLSPMKVCLSQSKPTNVAVLINLNQGTISL